MTIFLSTGIFFSQVKPCHLYLNKPGSKHCPSNLYNLLTKLIIKLLSTITLADPPLVPEYVMKPYTVIFSALSIFTLTLRT